MLIWREAGHAPVGHWDESHAYQAATKGKKNLHGS